MRTESENTKRRLAESEKLIKENMEILKENEYKTREEVKKFLYKHSQIKRRKFLNKKKLNFMIVLVKLMQS